MCVLVFQSDPWPFVTDRLNLASLYLPLWLSSPFLPCVSWLIACQWDKFSGEDIICVWGCLGVWIPLRGGGKESTFKCVFGFRWRCVHKLQRLQTKDTVQTSPNNNPCCCEAPYLTACVCVSSEKVSGKYLVRLWPLTHLFDIPHPVQLGRRWKHIHTYARPQRPQSHTLGFRRFVFVWAQGKFRGLAFFNIYGSVGRKTWQQDEGAENVEMCGQQ